MVWGALYLAACGAGASSGLSPSGETSTPPDADGGAATRGDGASAQQAADGGVAPPTRTTAQSFPIEVLGADGTTVTVALPTLSAAQAAAPSLRLQVHALNFPGKATVQVNAAPPIVLANPVAVVRDAYDGQLADAGPVLGTNAIVNPDVAIDEPGLSYGGIGGSFTTLSLTVKLPAATLQVGPGNTVSFTFHQTSGFEGVTIGYRVLSMNLADGQGTLLLPPDFLPTDDPSTWTPPMSDAASLDAGEGLWRTAQLQESPLNSKHLLKAHCTDCHLQDGRDLQYFGFSNHSIVQRAIFHGLTEAQGNLIASFIRTRPVDVVGRPWNPPFQPGPGLDALPPAQWAAGAGIGAVVTDDSLAVSDQFPTAPTLTPITSTLSINLRQDRIALQLPDWNHWLPTTHPFDTVMSTQFTTTIDSRAAEHGGVAGPYATYQKIRAGLTSATATAYTTRAVLNPTIYGWQEPNQFGIDTGLLEQGMAGMALSFFDGTGTIAPNSIAASDSATDIRYSLALWSLVKQFEFFLEFDQATLYPGLMGATAEPRSWHTMSAGDASPHQLGGNEGGTFPVLRTVIRSVYLASAWDYVQIIANPGDSAVSRTIPWEYIDGPLYHLANDYSERPEGFRALLVSLKDLTEHHTGYIVTDNTSGEQCPEPAISCFDPHSDYSLDTLSGPTVMSNLGAAGPALINAGVAAWYATMTDPKYPAAWWSTMPSATVDCGEWSSTWSRAACSSEQIVPEYLWADLPALRKEGVDATLLKNIATLAQQIWPGPKTTPNDWMTQLTTGT